MSRRLKETKKQLDRGLIDYERIPFFERKPDLDKTCSYVKKENIIGRDADKKVILDVLLDPRVSEQFCYLTIVGLGGLGKTALAQLFFNDEMWDEFLLLWICVSDKNGKDFDVKIILCEILELLIRENIDSRRFTMEEVHKRFEEGIRGKKYFLVLDDVWNEDREKWLELEKYLRMGQRGSKIVVTTRSKKTASTIGNNHVYELKGLSHEDSWQLFEMKAFKNREKDPKLVMLGKRIVQKCCNNPLLIKIVGTGFLNLKDMSFYENNFPDFDISSFDANFSELMVDTNIDLTPSLKNCYTYCSVFPKDFEIDKEMLISLWIAQGYIMPLDSGQTIEDAAEESFLILLQRCFFKDVKKDEWGEIRSVKMHDFMHDIAHNMSEEETCVLTSKVERLRDNVRHVYVKNGYEGYLMCHTHIRSYFSSDLTDKQVEDMMALRALALCSPCLSLPYSLDKLLLLRFIKLDSANLLSLPDSITKLTNLQTLILHCIRLRELPKDFSNLINLRHLDISHCGSLIGLPLGMKKLTNLTVLLPCKFVVGYGDLYEEFKGLQFFTQIKGHLHLQIRENYRYEYGVSETEGTYLKDIMKHLSKVNIEFKDNCIDHEDVLKKLQLPPNLKGLKLQWYKGTTIPWSSQVSFVLPYHLVRIEIIQCHKLEQLPVLSKLPNLKSLFLDILNSVEYLEEVISNNSSSDSEEVAEFFPSLESLEIRWMSNLKGWWKGKEEGMRLNAFPLLSFLSMAFCPEFTSFSPDNLSELQLPCLRELHIERCGKFASNLVCPRLEKLNLDKINENLLITCENSQVDVVIKNRVNGLKSVRKFRLTGLHISNCIDWKVKNFSEFKKEFEKSCCSSLLTLAIENCEFIRRLSGLEHLTVLQDLTLDYNQQLIINEDDEEPWKSFHRSLRKLKFSSCNGPVRVSRIII